MFLTLNVATPSIALLSPHNTRIARAAHDKALIVKTSSKPRLLQGLAFRMVRGLGSLKNAKVCGSTIKSIKCIKAPVELAL